MLWMRVIRPAFCHQWEVKAQLTHRFGQPGECSRLPALQQEQIRTVSLLATVVIIMVGTGAAVLFQSGPSCEMKALLVRLEN